MADIPTYKSTLTGPELDEALRNIGKIQANIEKAAGYAETAEQYGTIVEQNQTAIQGIEDNLPAVQGAAANAQSAASNAQAAAQSAQEAKTAAQQALGFRTFFSAVSPDENGDLDPSRPMTTPTAQASWTIKSKGDRIQSVQVNGFTTQAGAGDPSPANIREISTGGMKLVEYTCTGQEAWITSALQSGVYRVLLPASALPVPEKIPASSSDQATIYSSLYKPATAAQSYTGVESVSIPGGSGGIYICDSAYTSSDPAPWKNHLQALYAAGTPLEFWYEPAVESQATGLYVPIQAQGHEYRCQMLELTEPLCDGDKVESNVPSGCDKRIVFDGSSDESWNISFQNNGFYIEVPDVVTASADNVLTGAVFSDYLTEVKSASIYNATVPYGIALYTTRHWIFLRIQGVTTVGALKSYLQDHPLTVWYRSTAYTEADDISVALEMHSGMVEVLKASDNWQQKVPSDGATGTTQFDISLPFPAKRTAPLCSVFNGISDDAGTNVRIENTVLVTERSSASVFLGENATLEDLQSILESNQKIVYKLSAPAVYAHDPVKLVAVPYTESDATAAQQLANAPSTLPYIDSADVPMLLDDTAQPMALAAPLASALPVAGTYVVSSQDGTTVLVSLKAMQDGGDAATIGGQTIPAALLNLVYPVGSIYMSTNASSPRTFLGGTWQQIQGRFLLAASSSYPAGSTGGEAAHTLTINEMPAHKHSLNGGYNSGGTSSGQWRADANKPLSPWGDTGTTGGGRAHNNMPPYLAVYVWQRTA